MIQPNRPNPFASRPAGHFATLECTNGDYHTATDGISNSMLSVFLDDPALFHGRYITGEYPAPPPTPEMEFGSLVHAVLLENVDPMEWLLGDALIIPRWALNKDGHRKGPGWTEYAKANAGKRLVKDEEVSAMRETAVIVEAIRASVKRDRMAAQLLYETVGMNEYGVEFTHDATGLLLRAKLDRLTESPLLIADLKTTAKVDTESLSATCWKWGYARQAALYRRAIAAAEGTPPPFIVIALRKSQPYTVCCVRLDGEFLELGNQQLEQALTALASCRDRNCFEPPTAHCITSIGPPRYARYSTNDWSLDE